MVFTGALYCLEPIGIAVGKKGLVPAVLWFLLWKIGGYSLFAVIFKGVYGSSRNAIVRLVLVRTVLGMAIGPFVWAILKPMPVKLTL